MKSKVYFTSLNNFKHGDSILVRLGKLFDKAGLAEIISENDLTAIKLHFGEPGNTTFLRPIFVREIVDQVKKVKGNPFLTDTNTLYFGKRDNSVNHINSAIRNGFAYAVVDAPIIIADGLKGKNTVKVKINKKHFSEVTIAGDILHSESMIVLSHVKGHELAGFGGTIKNLAMGCAGASGKQQQHSTTKPKINKKCIGCGKCTHWCPETAITVIEKKAKIDKSKCVGCGECIAMCPVNAIRPQWKTDYYEFQERMVEYAYGAVKEKQNNNKIAYINFIMDVTPHCDCKAWSEPPIINDVGILASFDPVAIDKASYDLVNNQLGLENTLLSCNHSKGEDKFFAIENREIDVTTQFSYGQDIGLGNMDYELIKI